VTALRSGDRELLDLVDTATEVAFDVDGIVNGSGIDDEAGVELATEFSRRIESIAESLGIERVRSSTDQHIFAAGLGTPETAVDLAADFALRVVEAIDDFRQSHGVEVTYRAGMSAGHVIAGLLSADELAYGVLGEPSRVALALAGVAGSDQILIDSETAADLEGPWVLETATGLVDLRGNELTAVVLQGRSEQTDREDSTS
jgi:class 3 adenylate cyclase